MVEPELIAEMDRIADERLLSRSDVMRDLLRRGLAQYRREQELLRQMEEGGTRS